MDADRGPFRGGDRFLKYEIRSLLGRGGHAFVYAAHDPFLNMEVAIKVIPSARSRSDLAARARGEARLLIRIRHENVVEIADAGVADDGLVYIVMERLVGRDLRRVLNEYRRLSVTEALTVAIQAADGVAAAHRAGAIHRDLKPENIFIQRGNRLKVLDFGIAKVLGHGAPTTRKDLLHGTVLYMAPEQLKGLRATERSDVFALGTLLYEALHRHPVLLGSGVPSFREVGRLQVSLMPPLLHEVNTAIPRHVSKLIQRAILKKPEQRYASMAEFAEATRAALRRVLKEAGPSKPMVRDLGAGSEPPCPASARGSGVTLAEDGGTTEVVLRPSFTPAGVLPRESVSSLAPTRTAAAHAVRPSGSQLTPTPTTSMLDRSARARTLPRAPIMPRLLTSAAFAAGAVGIAGGAVWSRSLSPAAPPVSAALATVTTAPSQLATVELATGLQAGVEAPASTASANPSPMESLTSTVASTAPALRTAASAGRPRPAALKRARVETPVPARVESDAGAAVKKLWIGPLDPPSADESPSDPPELPGSGLQ